MSGTRALKAGIAIYNTGEYHAAHDAWEDHWLDLETDTDDERFFHGLIQFTAAVYHASTENWPGARGLAESAQEYLAGLPDPYHGVALSPVRSYLDTLAADPAVIDESPPPDLIYDEAALTFEDLSLVELFIVAAVLADEYDYDETIIDDAIGYARPALDDGTTNPFLTLLVDFATEPDTRDLVFERLAAHVSQRRARDQPVRDLFEDPEHPPE